MPMGTAAQQVKKKWVRRNGAAQGDALEQAGGAERTATCKGIKSLHDPALLQKDVWLAPTNAPQEMGSGEDALLGLMTPRAMNKGGTAAHCTYSPLEKDSRPFLPFP